MSKTFDVAEAQTRRLNAQRLIVGRWFVHYKGDRYFVEGISVDEATGGLRVDYRSLNMPDYYWSRTLENFTEYVNPTRENPDGVPRFREAKPEER